MSSEPFPPAAPAPRRLPDVAATHAFAGEVAAELEAGPARVVGLVGDLGAGKTEFVRGLARALGLPASEPIASPSYLLLDVHRGGRRPLAHYDAYFMQSADDIERAGLSELLREGCVVAVEWAERVAEALPANTLWIELAEAGDGHVARRLAGRPDGSGR